MIALIDLGPADGRPRRPERRPRRWSARLVLAAAAVSLGASPASEVLPGPIPARVVEVIDGDTVRVRARIWLGQEIEISVRFDGIDAPERHGKCAEERRLAEAARDFVAARLKDRAVQLHDVHYGKYAGRVVARAVLPSGEDVARSLVAAGLARAYDGKARGGWCAV